MSRWRLLLADDHELFRAGLVSLLATQPDLQVVGQARDGFEALKLARELRPALVIMDISMPICDGLEATRLIRATPDLATIPILILTVHEEDEKLFEAVKAGANGYLLKSSNAAEFLQGVRAALNGEALLPPRLAAKLMGEFARLAAQAEEHASAQDTTIDQELTWREQEVLKWLATGASDGEIAEKLMLSVHTVKTHVRHILTKLHAANRRTAVAEAKRRGWLPPSPSRTNSF
uniref:Response regulator transcription factor n=1 Tax=Caldilinea aerophila TaxID=133453 RepID=A0A7C1JFX2_9CHLR